MFAHTDKDCFIYPVTSGGVDYYVTLRPEKKMKENDFKNFINNQWIGDSDNIINVYNPATGKSIGTVPNFGAEETRQAIEAAHKAFKAWSKTPAKVRSNYLKRVRELIVENKEELAEIITKEMGKPIAEARGEIDYTANFFEWNAEEAKRVYGRIIPGRDENNRMQVIKQPVGVVASISPWNFPAAALCKKLPAALAAGCTIVIKPASQAPITAIKLMELFEKAEVPKGVVNLVTGKSSEIGAELMSNPKVRKVSFTGSTEIGKLLIKQSADNVKKLSLELGGHAPFIILDDADMEKAVQGVLACKFRASGQTCICANRVYVQKKVYNKFVELFAKEVKKFNVGNGLDDNVNMGPIIDKHGYQKVKDQVDDAVEKGATLVVGGPGECKEDNVYYYLPTVLKDITSDMIIMEEETFGPVAPVQMFEDDNEAIQLANDSVYGLASYVYTASLKRGTKIAEELEYGIVGWNDGAPSAPEAPFGGVKESGYASEGGIEGVDAYLETKYISMNLI